MSFELTRESWATVWPEAQKLAAAHSLELGENYLPDEGLLAEANAAGAFHIFGARSESGALLGYICWSVGRNPERKGHLMAQQGPWYVQPGVSCGRDLFMFSLDELRALGIRCFFPHHRFNSRARGLEQFFVSLGARQLQIVYELEVK